MADYPQVSIDTAGKELNRLHYEIMDKMRASVKDAIRAGEIISKIKAQLPHGDFIPWIRANCTFSERTARNYLGVFEHRDKTASLADLQEAYRQVETLEAQEKRSESERAGIRVKEYLKTGTKPEGWRRGTDDKIAAEEKQSRERVKKIQDDIRAEHTEKIRGTKKIDVKATVKELTGMIEARETFKDRIRLSHEGKSEPFVDAIMDYLETLGDDNRRLEACYNIIKVAKAIASELTRKTA